MHVPQRKGDPLLVDTDEGVRPGTTAESLGALKPAFDKNGTITAGNASQISDGGAAVIVMSADKAKELGIAPLGQIVSYGQVAGPDTSLLTQPSRAIAKAAKKAGLDLERHRPLRDQRGLCRRRPGLGGRSGDRRGQDQRERRRHRPRPPGRHVGHPGGARPRCSSCVGAAPARRQWPSAAAAARATPPSCASSADPSGPSASAASALAESGRRRDEQAEQRGALCVHFGPRRRCRGGRRPGAQVGKPRRTTRSRPLVSAAEMRPAARACAVGL